MKLFLLEAFLCFQAAVSDCVPQTMSLTQNRNVNALLTDKARLYFQIPANAQVMPNPYPGADDYTITVVSDGSATIGFSSDTISVQAGSMYAYADNSPSWTSPLALWTGAAGAATLLSRDVDRAVLGTTAVIAASSLINVALASQCDTVEIYFNMPKYQQDSIPTSGTNRVKFVAFFYQEQREKVSITVQGGTCSRGQCGSCGEGG